MKKIRIPSFLLAGLLSLSLLVSCDSEPSDPPAGDGNGEVTAPSYGENTVDYDALS